MFRKRGKKVEGTGKKLAKKAPRRSSKGAAKKLRKWTRKLGKKGKGAAKKLRNMFRKRGKKVEGTGKKLAKKAPRRSSKGAAKKLRKWTRKLCKKGFTGQPGNPGIMGQ